MAAATSKMKLKLLIDKRKNKVLFAEARKDFVDFLFHILSLPVGTCGGSGTKTIVADDSIGEGGYVKETLRYTVTDALKVLPVLSMIDGLSLVNKYHNKEIGHLEEKLVECGIDEGLALLNASLQTTSALTDVFLTKKEVGD